MKNQTKYKQEVKMMATKSQKEASKEMRKAKKTGKNPFKKGSQAYTDFEKFRK